jgi:hypothetical protein
VSEGDNDYWFRARDYGYGVGLPLNWKGWALLAALICAMLGGQYLIQRLLPQHDWAIAVVLAVIFVIAPLVWLAWRKTEGGWHSRD